MSKFISPGSHLSTWISGQMGTTGPSLIGSQMGTTGQVPKWELLYRFWSTRTHTPPPDTASSLHSAPAGARAGAA